MGHLVAAPDKFRGTAERVTGGRGGRARGATRGLDGLGIAPRRRRRWAPRGLQR